MCVYYMFFDVGGKFAERARENESFFGGDEGIFQARWIVRP